jgi:hypothetical protein
MLSPEVADKDIDPLLSLQDDFRLRGLKYTVKAEYTTDPFQEMNSFIFCTNNEKIECFHLMPLCIEVRSLFSTCSFVVCKPKSISVHGKFLISCFAQRIHDA